jgi:hypothetical protein
MTKKILNFQHFFDTKNFFSILILLALAWLFFHSELNEPEIHAQTYHHFDYCQLVTTAIQSHQPVFQKVELCFDRLPYFETELINSITDQNHFITNLPLKFLPLILITKQLLI